MQINIPSLDLLHTSDLVGVMVIGFACQIVPQYKLHGGRQQSQDTLHSSTIVTWVIL